MRIKRFEAPDTRSALAMVKECMGDNAVILATRPLGGKAQRYGRAVEVVAAMDYDLEELTDTIGHRDRASAPQTVEPTPPAAIGTGNSTPLPLTRANREWSGTDINSEARDLRRRFAGVVHGLGGAESSAKTPMDKPGHRRGKPRPNPQEVEQWRNRLIEQIQVQPPTPPTNDREPLIMALVGATGVGKTTTAAKLAAWYSLREGRKVTLLSTDCYRIGATEQLRTYARIMRLPCEIALRTADLSQAIERNRDRDVIIIDTAGKSPYDKGHLAELGEWFTEHPAIAPYLVLPATAKKEDLKAVLQAYQPLTPAGLILSKLDETRAYAALCQQIVGAALPVACLCTGQRVPEDFLMASRNRVDLLFGEGWPAIAEKVGACQALAS